MICGVDTYDFICLRLLLVLGQHGLDMDVHRSYLEPCGPVGHRSSSERAVTVTSYYHVLPFGSSSLWLRGGMKCSIFMETSVPNSAYRKLAVFWYLSYLVQRVLF